MAESGPSFVPSMPRIGLARRSLRWASRIVPGLVWLAAAAGVVVLVGREPEVLPLRGMATVSRHIATPALPGHLETLLVARLAKVEQDQILGRLSGAALALQARQVGQQISGLRAEMIEQRQAIDRQLSEAQRDAEADLRRFTRDVENVKLDNLRLVAELEEARVRREGLGIDLKRLDALAEEQLVSEAEQIRMRTEFQALGTRISRGEETLRWHQTRLQRAQGRLKDYRPQEATAKVEAPGGSFRWRIAEAETALELIALQRTRLVIRAPRAGVVEELHAKVGEHLEPGRPLVTIVESNPKDLIAYVPMGTARALAVGSPVRIQTPAAPGQTFATKVLQVGPAAAELPAQLRAMPQTPEWAVPVLLEPRAGIPTLPGESFQVEFGNGG